MKYEAKKTKNYEALSQVVRGAKQLSKQRRQELLSAVYSVPNSTRNIKEFEIEEWMKLHNHPDKNHGVIGGNISKTETYTSIGTLTTYFCSSCKEQATIAEGEFDIELQKEFIDKCLERLKLIQEEKEEPQKE